MSAGFLVKTNAIFVEKEECKNPAWLKLKFKLDEVYKDNLLTAASQKYPNYTAIIPATEWPDYDYLQRNQTYSLDLITNLEKANGNYPAKVSFRLFGVAPASRDLQAV